MIILCPGAENKVSTSPDGGSCASLACACPIHLDEGLMMRIHRGVSRVLTCVLVVTSIGATVGAAQAGTARDSSQETATSQVVIAAAGRAQGSTITQTAQGLNVSAASGTIQLPLKATGAITSGNVQIGLPDLGGANATVAEDGTVVYRNNGVELVSGSAKDCGRSDAQNPSTYLGRRPRRGPVPEGTGPLVMVTGSPEVSSRHTAG
jgi:hypothetical protein